MLGLKRASKQTCGGGGKLEEELELELELGLALAQDRTGQDRQDLCDRLEARNGLRERDRWKVLDWIIQEVDDPFPDRVLVY